MNFLSLFVKFIRNFCYAELGLQKSFPSLQIASTVPVSHSFLVSLVVLRIAIEYAGSALS